MRRGFYVPFEVRSVRRTEKMPRVTQPDLAHLDRAPVETATLGVRVLSAKDVGDVVRVARLRYLGRQIDATERLGVSRSMLGGLERGEGGSQLDLTLRVLTDLGIDVVLVPRDSTRPLRDTKP